MGSFPAVNKMVSKKVSMTTSTNTTHNPTTQHHPDLENLYFMDKLTKNRVNPNGDPILIDNEYYTGKMLIMVRTSDVDEDNTDVGSKKNQIISKYFREAKKRRFEVQLQVKFKKIPTSTLFLSLGYDKPVQLGSLQRTFLEGTMRFCRMSNPTFSYHLCPNRVKKEQAEKNCTDHRQGQSGSHNEKPHFAFPIETSLHRIAITKPGKEVPQLGSQIDECPEAMENRVNRSKKIEFNTHDTYTFSVWSDNIDFISWKAINLPAIPKFSLTHINDSQPMNVQIYSLRNANNRKHMANEMEMLLDMKVSNFGITSMTNDLKRWIKEEQDAKANNDLIVDNTVLPYRQKDYFKSDDERIFFDWIGLMLAI